MSIKKKIIILSIIFVVFILTVIYYISGSSIKVIPGLVQISGIYLHKKVVGYLD